MLERLTSHAKKVLQPLPPPATIAEALNKLLEDDFGAQSTILRELNVNRALLKSALNEYKSSEGLGQFPSAKKLPSQASRVAKRLHHNYIGSEHLLVAILELWPKLERPILQRHGLTVHAAIEAIMAPLLSPAIDPAEDALPCSHCGYDLRGLNGVRCPECGHLLVY